MREVDVDLARLFQHAKASRWCIEEGDKGLRQDVLASVLLHMIEPASPVDAPFDILAARGCRALHDVQDAVVTVVNTLNNARAVQYSGVARLSSASWIEGGAIKNDGGPAANSLGNINHTSFKL